MACSLQCINGGTCVLVKKDCSDPTAPFDTPVCDCGAPAADSCFYGARCESKIQCNSPPFEAQAQSCNVFVAEGRGGVETSDVCHADATAPTLCTAGRNSQSNGAAGTEGGSTDTPVPVPAKAAIVALETEVAEANAAVIAAEATLAKLDKSTDVDIKAAAVEAVARAKKVAEDKEQALSALKSTGDRCPAITCPKYVHFM